jgi:non-specific serine/threonine protein kinase
MHRSATQLPPRRSSDDARLAALRWTPSLERHAAAGRASVLSLRALPAEPSAPAETPVAPPEPPIEVPTERQDRLHAAGWRHNLPQPLTSFVGREREIAEVSRLLASARLLTLVGTGGVGKTRLGHEVAARVLDRFSGGVWVVELSALTDPALVPQAVAAVLDVRVEADRPLTATLAAALRAERILLVLDNCEHVIEACASLADALLRACPDLSILATSRQALGIGGETTFCVPSLSLSARWGTSTAGADGHVLPDASGPAAPRPIEPLLPSESARLFAERAGAVVPSFALSDRNVGAVEQICRRLDGIPLAIELAAARVGVLSPEQIEARLDDRFRLLSGGSRTALPRYRTLRAMIDWSHDLLDEQERTLLRRLAVFSGGWTLDAAESVCAGDGLAAEEILDLLSGLVAKSLVLTGDGADEVRYGFLESLREYAAEKLRDAGEEARLRERHGAWFLALAERAEPRLSGSHSVPWLDSLERERENLRAVLAWCVDRGDAEAGLALVGALDRFWLVRGPYRETRDTLTELLTLAQAQEQADSGTDRTVRTRALFALGRLDMRQDDRAAAELRYREALAASRELGDRRGEAVALFAIGHVVRVRGEYEAARRWFEQARELFEALDDRYWLAQTYQELGVAAFYEGDLATARVRYEASLTIYKGLGDEPGVVGVLDDLGEVAFLEGDLDRARTLLRASLEMARRIGDKERIAMALMAVAGIAVAEGQPRRALRLAAAASGLNDATGQRNSPAWHAMVDRWLAPAYRALSADDVAAVQAAGRVMPLDEAIEYALSSAHPAFDAPAPDSPAPAGPLPAPPVSAASAANLPVSLPERAGRALRNGSAGHGPAGPAPLGQQAAPPWQAVSELTPRELEVAALVARGLTNRQIAEALVITEGTAANHVKHILARLVLDSRVQIAAWAIERGLTRQASA